ncbi:preprotein translocase subunit YajC [Rhodococcus erythropolis]|jgi:preprotein translocase subunit YajC|uniref:Preprotein translocase subunit YajC n=3 Tax=Rhodococcus TaxID=1827 RepID=A0A0C2VNW4_RHOER|nr:MULTISPECIES: preprotein translocase subunit YajC [Rhodococcus]ERB52993.1 protein-export membrane protein YajC [Rhodococcus sp. P27]MCD2157423.1 preprotein translocase subunit YajC [Rhodococcus cerastii]MCW0193958.1 preprotein translocase subunit YajC [Rhodococcus sp. (in: high G+C Gram-positive bacteria)]AGT92525.1 protein-export membrane protein YajC [Rhodococcus erythropolis CCM2595]AKD97641.1 preprotein translocase subunit YajC [Rhodococcus erythropolis]
MSSLLFPLLILALLVPMFLGMRKQKKALAATSEMQDSLQVGDRVQTTAGLYATIASLDDDTVDLEIADGVITTWSRLVIRERVVETTETDEYDDDSVSEIEESAADTEIRLTKES